MPVRSVLLVVLVALSLAACAAAPADPSGASGSGAPPPTSVASSEADVSAPPSAAEPTPTPTATPSPTPPAAPTGVKLRYRYSDPHHKGYGTDETVTISWAGPMAKGVTMRVYGVTVCLPPVAKDHQPCLVRHTPLPSDSLELLAKAPSVKGSVSWTWPNPEITGGAAMIGHGTQYWSVVIAAYGPDAHSRFVIVDTGEYCPDCTY
jgi:hypothetical protein